MYEYELYSTQKNKTIIINIVTDESNTRVGTFIVKNVQKIELI